MASSAKFEDGFTESVDTDLDQHKPDFGDGWLVGIDNGGIIKVEADSDSIVPKTTEVDKGILYVIDDALANDQWVEVWQINAGQAGYSNSLALRFTDSTHWYVARLNDARVIFYRQNGGGITSLANIPFTNPDYTWIAFEVVGTSLKLYLNGIEVANTTNSDLTSGKSGVGMGAVSVLVDDMDPAYQELDWFRSGNGGYLASFEFLDTFTEASADTDLDSHTPDVGTSWTILYQISGEELEVLYSTDQVHPKNGGEGYGCVYTADETSRNHRIGIRVEDWDGPWFLLARIQDSNNFYALKLTTTSAELYKKVSGSWDILGTTFTVAQNQFVELEVDGSSIKARINGTVVRDITDTAITSPGKPGIGIGDLLSELAYTYTTDYLNYVRVTLLPLLLQGELDAESVISGAATRTRNIAGSVDAQSSIDADLTPLVQRSAKFEDGFTESVDTDLEDHNPDFGDGWTIGIDNSGVVKVEADSDSIVPTSIEDDKGRLFVIDNSIANDQWAEIYVIKSYLTTSTQSLAVRFTDSTHWYILRFHKDHISIRKKNGGSVSNVLYIDQVDIVLPYTYIAIEVVGTTLKVFTNGELVDSAVDSDLVSGKSGVGMGATAIDTDNMQPAYQELDWFRTGEGSYLSSFKFLDTFDEDSDTDLDLHVPTQGTSWTKLISNIGAELEVDGATKQLHPKATVDDGGCAYVANVVCRDYRVGIRVEDLIAFWFILARVQDANNFYALEFVESSDYGQLYKKVAGVWTPLGSSITLVQNDFVELEVEDQLVKVLINGTVVVEVTDTAFPNQGKPGIGTGSLRQPARDVRVEDYIDNFRVTLLPPSLSGSIDAQSVVSASLTPLQQRSAKFEDGFTESVDTDLEDHKPDYGKGWLVIDDDGGVIKVEADSDSVVPASAVTDQGIAYSIDGSLANDQWVEVYNIKKAPSDLLEFTIWLIARLSDLQNFYTVRIASTSFQIRKVFNNSLSLIDSRGIAQPIYQWIAFEILGNLVNTYIDHKLFTSVEDNDLVSGITGLAMGSWKGRLASDDMDPAYQELDWFRSGEGPYLSSFKFLDTFDEDSDTDLDLHIPTQGTSWTKLISINGAELEVEASTDRIHPKATIADAGCIYTANVVCRDHRVGIRVEDLQSNVYLLARIQDENNFYAVELVENTGVGRLWRVVSGSWLQLGSNFTITQNDFVELEVGDSIIKVLINGTIVREEINTSISNQGKPGIGVGSLRVSLTVYTTDYVDNFRVTLLPPSLYGTLDAESTIEGFVSVNRGIEGSADAQSAISGSLSAEVPIVGTLDAVSTIEGFITAEVPIAGSISSTSYLEGFLSAIAGMHGTISATATLTGFMLAEVPIAGLLAATSAIVGKLREIIFRGFGGRVTIVAGQGAKGKAIWKRV